MGEYICPLDKRLLARSKERRTTHHKKEKEKPKTKTEEGTENVAGHEKNCPMSSLGHQWI